MGYKHKHQRTFRSLLDEEEEEKEEEEEDKKKKKKKQGSTSPFLVQIEVESLVICSPS